MFSGFGEAVFASAELDRKYALESVGVLQAWDNVDGLFAETVGFAYQDFFSRQNRFRFQDISKATEVLSKSKIPLDRLLEDKEILGQLARAMRAETLIRTRIYKEGTQYRFVLDWLHAPRLDLLGSETFRLEEPQERKGFSRDEIQTALLKSLEKLLAQVPFIAHVTGRDHQSVTVNLGRDSGVRPGDTLLVSGLEAVKKHPLLYSVVGWELVYSGKLLVEAVDGGMAFCRVSEETAPRPISRYQKVTQIVQKPIITEPSLSADNEEEGLRGEPRFGFANGGLWLGSFSRQFSTLGGTIGKAGGGFFTGAKVDGQLWLTRHWFAELALGYGFSGYSQSDIATGTATPATGASQSVLHWRLDGGYTYFASKEGRASKAWIKWGYRSTSYSLPISTTEATAPISFKGFFVGVGGELPLREKFGARLAFDFGFLGSATETGEGAVAIQGASDVSFFIGGYYHFGPRMTLTAGLDVMAHGAEYADESSLIQKVVSIGPSLVYLF